MGDLGTACIMGFSIVGGAFLVSFIIIKIMCKSVHGNWRSI